MIIISVFFETFGKNSRKLFCYIRKEMTGHIPFAIKAWQGMRK